MEAGLTPMEVGVCFLLKKPLLTNQDASFIWKGYFYDNISLSSWPLAVRVIREFFCLFLSLHLGSHRRVT